MSSHISIPAPRSFSGIALDSWSSIQNPDPITAHTLVDDVEIEELCDPLAGIGAVETVSESFQFTEGPLWLGDHLLFSDIDGDTIHRHDPPAAFSIFRSPSDRANGLALTPSLELLATGCRCSSRAFPDGFGDRRHDGAASHSVVPEAQKRRQ